MTKGPAAPFFRDEKIDIDEEAAFQSIQGLINDQRINLKEFDSEAQKNRMEQGGPEGIASNLDNCDITELKMAQAAFDFSTVVLDSAQRTVEAPKGFKGDLKEYQLKGLRWLDNLYEQGINGILADEMGLGKTIQAIALMAHISEAKGNFGPFLVVAPASTLYNWQQEITRFCPMLRVLPYWGSLKERKTIRKYFSQKLWGAPASHFHVVITSYQLIVADEKAFQRMRWQYMILDEAQAIKNINSMRWKTLLSFNARNKLLLTGTPIQNSMAELWALLHFIMPKLFDSHEQFQEWFSKDIEAHSTDQKALNQHQLQRLHAILKPFMLRRVKKDVENEIGQKKEIQVLIEMTNRQKELYNTIKQHLSLKDFFKIYDSKAKFENLMNLVMQFRKVRSKISFKVKGL
jgi:DNA helicase INO80